MSFAKNSRWFKPSPEGRAYGDERKQRTPGRPTMAVYDGDGSFMRIGEYQRCPENVLDGVSHARPSSQTTVVQRRKLCELRILATCDQLR